jgi:hypothetical protein
VVKFRAIAPAPDGAAARTEVDLMSWMERELKKRSDEKAAGDSAPQVGGSAPARSISDEHAQLWSRIEAANNALPVALRLRRDVRAPGSFVGAMPAFPVALVAQNRACLGLTEEGIRYLWPAKSSGPSHNFWIRFKPGKGLVVAQRVNPSPSHPVIAEHPFDEDSIEHMIKCLVTSERIKPAALRPGKRFFLWSRR